MPFRIWKAGHHEVMETVLRRRYEPQDEMTLEEAAGGSFRWRVLSVEKHPHGWRTTATRCLPGCREHPPSRPA
ncbi:MAG TPA: hypothetical protein VLU06_08030 [Thermoanaerobaculia bacterium]|jgi:hypothetical protein|nr:hypothetical protein [Thermoanaerobaculia bacterium]